MSSLLQHAKAELRAAGLFDPDADFDGLVAQNVVALMETFVAAGHSGTSGEFTVALFRKLARGIAITPLTGEDDEWEDRSVENSGQPLWQNKRASTVFKTLDKAWDVEDETLAPITFPYTPK